MLNQRKDTAAPLWEELFMVRIPQLQMTSTHDIEKFGSYTTGDRGIDTAMSNQWRTTMIPISKMVEFYQEGCQIKIVHEADVKKIYELISDHLNAWKDTLTNGINVGNAPVEDLIAMDEFANAVYAHAKYQFTQETISSILARHLTTAGAFNSSNFFKESAKIKVDEEAGVIRINADSGPQFPERESLGDFLKDNLSTLRRW